MGTVTVSRKQRLRTLEKAIRQGMEEFYYTGMKLKEIRDDELYKEDGFATWEAYCRKRWEWGADYARKLIRAADYRDALPSAPKAKSKTDTNSIGQWSELSVRELTRIPNKRQAARVAQKIVKEVEKSRKQAAADPGVKPLNLSASTVRKFVDEDLGVDRAAKAKQTKQAEKRPELRDYLDRKTGTIEGVLEALQQVPKDAWLWLNEDNPQLVKRLITACNSLATFLRKVV